MRDPATHWFLGGGRWPRNHPSLPVTSPCWEGAGYLPLSHQGLQGSADAAAQHWGPRLSGHGDALQLIEHLRLGAPTPRTFCHHVPLLPAGPGGPETDGAALSFSITAGNSIPALPGPARTLPPSLTHTALTFLMPPSGSCADPAGRRSRPQSSPRGRAAASPATRPRLTAGTWGQCCHHSRGTATSAEPWARSVHPAPCSISTTTLRPFLSPTGSERLVCLGHSQVEPRQEPTLQVMPR